MRKVNLTCEAALTQERRGLSGVAIFSTPSFLFRRDLAWRRAEGLKREPLVASRWKCSIAKSFALGSDTVGESRFSAKRHASSRCLFQECAASIFPRSLRARRLLREPVSMSR